MPREIKHAIITFLECSLVGGWKTEVYDPIGEVPETQTELRLMKAKNFWTIYRVWKEGAEVQLVRPDGLVRRFSFRLGSVIYVGESAVKFNQNEVIEEFSVDQDEQVGNRPKGKVVGT